MHSQVIVDRSIASPIDEEEEMTQKCRVCTISSDCFSYLNIFEKIIFKNVRVLDALVLITNLQIRPDDDFPKTICCRCEQRLLDAYHFRRLAESSAKQFEKISSQLGGPAKPVTELPQPTKIEEISSHTPEISVTVNDGEIEVYMMDTDCMDDCKEENHEASEDEMLTALPQSKAPKERVPVKRKSMILQRLTSKKPPQRSHPVEPPRKRYKSSIIHASSAAPQTLNEAPQRNAPTEDVVSVLIAKLETDGDHVPSALGASAAVSDPEYAKRKYECQVCNKRFVGKSNLIDHLRFHANVKPFKCDQCDKSFVQSGSLQCHLRTHTKEKPYVCSYCAKAFGQSSSLKIHIRSHTQERQYSCEICDKRFKSNSDLMKHRGIHDTVKRYKCDICGDRFAQKGNLQKHIRRNHVDGEVSNKRSK